MSRQDSFFQPANVEAVELKPWKNVTSIHDHLLYGHISVLMLPALTVPSLWHSHLLGVVPVSNRDMRGLTRGVGAADW
jgi:hypothetical protein